MIYKQQVPPSRHKPSGRSQDCLHHQCVRIQSWHKKKISSASDGRGSEDRWHPGSWSAAGMSGNSRVRGKIVPSPGEDGREGKTSQKWITAPQKDSLVSSLVHTWNPNYQTGSRWYTEVKKAINKRICPLIRKRGGHDMMIWGRPWESNCLRCMCLHYKWHFSEGVQ